MLIDSIQHDLDIDFALACWASALSIFDFREAVDEQELRDYALLVTSQVVKAAWARPTTVSLADSKRSEWRRKIPSGIVNLNLQTTRTMKRGAVNSIGAAGKEFRRRLNKRQIPPLFGFWDTLANECRSTFDPADTAKLCRRHEWFLSFAAGVVTSHYPTYIDALADPYGNVIWNWFEELQQSASSPMERHYAKHCDDILLLLTAAHLSHSDVVYVDDCLKVRDELARRNMATIAHERQATKLEFESYLSKRVATVMSEPREAHDRVRLFRDAAYAAFLAICSYPKCRYAKYFADNLGSAGRVSGNHDIRLHADMVFGFLYALPCLMVLEVYMRKDAEVWSCHFGFPQSISKISELDQGIWVSTIRKAACRKDKHQADIALDFHLTQADGVLYDLFIGLCILYKMINHSPSESIVFCTKFGIRVDVIEAMLDIYCKCLVMVIGGRISDSRARNQDLLTEVMWDVSWYADQYDGIRSGLGDLVGLLDAHIG